MESIDEKQLDEEPISMQTLTNFIEGKINEKEFYKFAHQNFDQTRELLQKVFEFEEFQKFGTTEFGAFKWAFPELMYFWAVQENVVHNSVVRLIDSMRQLSLKCENWTIHRNLCFVIGRILDLQVDWATSRHFRDSIFDYLMNILHDFSSEFVDLNLLALLTIEKAIRYEWEPSGQNKQLFQILSMITLDNDDDEIVLLNLYEKSNSTKIQLNFLIHWFLKNILDPEWIQITLKFTPDRLSVRNDTHKLITIRSAFEVQSGVYFYEAIPLINEFGSNIRFGWTTRESWLSDRIALGDQDEHSIGFDPVKKGIFHNKKYFIGQNLPLELMTHDVIGCLIDFENRKFEFYLNGILIESSLNPYFSELSYFAAASLTTHQQIHFNFGQMTFNYPPKNRTYKNFHDSCDHNSRKYNFSETDQSGHRYFFRNKNENQIQPKFYHDSKQEKWDQLVCKIENDLNNPFFWKPNPLELELELIRFIQSFIEKISSNESKFDLILLVSTEILEHLVYRCETSGKLAELIDPYCQNMILLDNEQNWEVQRNLNIVLAIVISFYEVRFELDYRYTFDRFVDSLIGKIRMDSWGKIFALLGLERLELSQEGKTKLRNIPKLISALKSRDFETKNYYKVSKFYGSCTEARKYQFEFCCAWFRDHFLFLLKNKENEKVDPNSAILNPKDMTKYLKYSPDLLSVRSDWHWQSCRSVCSVLETTIYFYEVVLLTNGPMRFGWATKRTELNLEYNFCQQIPKDSPLGLDEYSIAFDGFNRCMWHEGKCFPSENNPQWKAGDVVGCLIDMDKRKFGFYLNGVEILVPENLFDFYFSTYPYYAAVSLYWHQHCYCNFGQEQFKYPPKRVDYLDFYNSSKILDSTIEGNLARKPTSSGSMNFNNLTNVSITVSSISKTGNQTFTSQ